MARQADADDWEDLRDLRLRALGDTPEAFGTTLAQAAARSDDEWRGRYAPHAGSVDIVEEDETGLLVGTELEVNPAVAAAARLYERCGYRPTGRSRSLRDRPDITVVELAKDL